MRIALFSEVFLPKVDGIVNTLCRLLEHLQQRGHTSLLFAPAGGPCTYAATQVIGLNGTPFPLYPDLHLVSPFVNIRRHLDAFRPDIIHLLNPLALGLAGLRYHQDIQRKMNTKLPILASYHTDLPGFAERWGMSALKPALWSYLRTIHNQVDMNLAPSHYTARELIENKFTKVRIWSRGVDTALFSPAHRSEEWRRLLTNGSPSSPLVIYVGRLSAEKRIDWLLDLGDSYPNVRLAIIGDGPQREELERRFAGFRDRVIFTGFLQGVQLAQAYAAGDIFAFPGANETFGNVVLEAMASGLPVVAPGSGGVLDFVRSGENGLLFRSSDRKSMIECLVWLLENPQQANWMGQNARQFALTRRWTTVLDELLAVYDELAHKFVHVKPLSSRTQIHFS